MSYDLDEFQMAARRIGLEHREAIQQCEDAGKRKASAERNYRALLARALTIIKSQHGATNAEKIAQGEKDVAEAKESVLIAEAEDRAAFQRVKLAEADRAVLLTMGSWSKSQENW